MSLNFISTSPLARRLEEYADLSPEDREVIDRISSHRIRTVSARRDLVREGESPSLVYLILEGWACHYRTLRNGRRQIVDFAIPGDLCDLNVYILECLDTSIAAITRLRVAEINRETFEGMTSRHPSITRALWWQELVTKSIHREWIVNVGQRTAEERIAHLLCEMLLRMQSVGLADDNECILPFTQIDIADATGLTAVHVNRTVQKLRRDGLILFQGRRLKVPDMARLRATGLFNPGYLHLTRLGKRAQARQAAAGARDVPDSASGEWTL